MTQTVILGWDALDADLIHKYRLTDAFGATERIDTISNPVIGKPHTLEVWPSMITGQWPDEHGITAPVSDGGGVEWSNGALNATARLADGVVPDALQTAIGDWLLNRGVDKRRYDAAHYDGEGISTVFDGGGRAISVPNYVTDYDRRHNLDPFRRDVWGAILPDRDHIGDGDIKVGIPTIWAAIADAVGERIGHTIAAVERGESLCWTWFGLLDTVGHVNPHVGAALERPAYELAARATETIRAAAPDDAVVVCVSDHGLQDGGHTRYATLATDHAPAHEGIEHVCDMPAFIGDVDGGTTAAGYETPGDLEDELEALGYL